MDPVSISALSAAVVIIIGAIVTGVVKIIQALHEARDERVIMKHEAIGASVAAKTVAIETKTAAEEGNQFIRADLKVITDSICALDRRVSSKIGVLSRHVNDLNQSQNDLLDLVVQLDSKMNDHIAATASTGEMKVVE